MAQTRERLNIDINAYLQTKLTLMRIKMHEQFPKKIKKAAKLEIGFTVPAEIMQFYALFLQLKIYTDQKKKCNTSGPHRKVRLIPVWVDCLQFSHSVQTPKFS